MAMENGVESGLSLYPGKFINTEGNELSDMGPGSLALVLLVIAGALFIHYLRVKGKKGAKAGNLEPLPPMWKKDEHPEEEELRKAA